jgi:hypothetical protein
LLLLLIFGIEDADIGENEFNKFGNGGIIPELIEVVLLFDINISIVVKLIYNKNI